jgi:hypothetical protein
MKPKDSYRYTFSFVFVDDGGLGGEGDLVRASREGIKDLVEVLLSEEAVQRLSE